MSRYLIRVNGHLSDELSASLRGLDAQHQPAQTILVGELADQAALTGILDRLDLLGVEIHEVLLVPDCPPVGVGAVLQAVPENGDTGRSATGATSPDSGEAPNVRQGDDDSPAGG
jgi:hypothetical protein